MAELHSSCQDQAACTGQAGRGARDRTAGAAGGLLYGNNTVAIVMTGPIAKEISQEYHLAEKKRIAAGYLASSVGQGLIPYGAQLLSCRIHAADAV